MPGQCQSGGRARILEEQGSMATDGSLEAGKGGVQPREARWASTAVILPRGGGRFHPRGAVGMDPKGGLSEHLRESSTLLKTKTKPKKSKKKTQKHS